MEILQESLKYTPQPIFWNGKKYIFDSNTENTMKNIQEIRQEYKDDCIFGDPINIGHRLNEYNEYIPIYFAKSILEAREKYNLIGMYLLEEYYEKANKGFKSRK
jgi:hypothetical protein